jgi:uncharacterized Fe-S cluster-containing radical SAM superfamily protein
MGGREGSGPVRCHVDEKTRIRSLPPGEHPHKVETMSNTAIDPANEKGAPLDPAKFRDPDWTANGNPRATVALKRLATLWFNTGTLCNLACDGCYIESSPTNDRLVYLGAAEVDAFLDEIADGALGTREIGFTGGEPFMNPDIIAMLESALARGFDVLVLTNAMRPMMKCADALLALKKRYGDALSLRVSLDHYSEAGHEHVRGPRSWTPALAGLRWLSENGFALAVAGRRCWAEDEAGLRLGFAELFAAQGIAVDAGNPAQLVLFPEMDAARDVPEITTACWDILGKSPDDIMCATARMVIKRKGDARPTVSPCTLLPFETAFDLGHTLAEASAPVALNHPHCAAFCVLGGASCSAPSADLPADLKD